MTLSANVKPEVLHRIPAVVHTDSTARYHTVNETQNPAYYALLTEFYKKTGLPVLINTSFNIKGQPITETPEDAIRTFLSTELDCLVMGNRMVWKEGVYPQFAFISFHAQLSARYPTQKLCDAYRTRWDFLKKTLFCDIPQDDFLYDPE